MTVATILERKGHEVVTTTPAATVKAAAELMRTRGIAALVVVARDLLLGVLTERDIAHAFARHGDGLSRMKVGDILERGPVTVAPEDSVTRAMALMTRHRVRHLPVLSAGRIVGLVSIGDVVKYRLDESELEKNVIRDAYIAAH